MMDYPMSMGFAGAATMCGIIAVLASTIIPATAFHSEGKDELIGDKLATRFRLRDFIKSRAGTDALESAGVPILSSKKSVVIDEALAGLAVSLAAPTGETFIRTVQSVFSNDDDVAVLFKKLLV